MSDGKKISRRRFINSAVAAGATFGLAAKGFPSIKPKYTPSELINVGIIGPGSRGCSLLRGFVGKAKNVQVTAVCDDLPSHLVAGKEIAGSQAKGYTDYMKMLEQKDLDCVIIATPPYLHSVMSVDALDSGKHVFCEKTLAYSIKQNKDIVEKVKETKLKFQVGMQRRSNPAYLTAMKMIKDGAIGKVTTIRAQWHRNGSWRRPLPDPKLERKINWRMYREYSVGLMGELATHQLDVVNWATGSRPYKVAGFGGIDYWKDGRETFDNVHLLYEYPGGVRVLYSSITTNAHYGCSEQIMGDKGTIELTESEGGKYFAEEVARKSTEFAAYQGNITEALQKKILVTGATVKPEDPSLQKAQEIEASSTNPTALQLFSFFDCIREDKEPFCNVEVGRDASVAALMGLKAMRSSDVIYWEPSFT